MSSKGSGDKNRLALIDSYFTRLDHSASLYSSSIRFKLVHKYCPLTTLNDPLEQHVNKILCVPLYINIVQMVFSG